jgi:hypothetical protein
MDEQQLVNMGMGIACRCLELIAHAKQEHEGNEHDAQVLESAAKTIELLAGRRR